MWSKGSVMLHRYRIPAVLLVAGIGAVVLWPRPAPQGGGRLRSELDLRNGLLYLQGETRPFTGILVENYAKDSRKLEIPIREGRANGLSRGWFENGQKEVEETFVGGVAHGPRRRWHENGAIKSESTIHDGILAGRFVQWHGNGQMAADVTMVQGQPHGPAHAWHASGRLKSRVALDHGTPGKKEFFPDGEPVPPTAKPAPPP